jgi:starch synthase
VAERAWDGRLPDVIHAHDWHAALALLYARHTRASAWSRVPLVFTIHNLAFQGVLNERELDYLGVPRDAWEHGWLRHEGNVNLMKGAIDVADRVTTVSETYAREILSPEHGYGLDAHLRHYRSKLVGIVNGIDTHSFDPATDGLIACRYGAGDAALGKIANKRALGAELALDVGDRDPLFAAISRLQWLKGTDLLLSVVPALVERGARIVLVGTGDPSLESGLTAAAARWPGRVASRIAFDPLLARRVFSAADFFVVPSRDEPCGLTQLYAMRYGAIPVVSPVGGLVDTVQPLDAAHALGTGLVADGVNASSLLLACEEALGVWSDPVGMPSLVARAMARDSAWTPSASRYLALYEGLAAAAQA